jgi:hypothetical protein
MTSEQKSPARKLLLISSLLVCFAGAVLFVMAADGPSVRVAPTNSVGPRTLEKQTETAVVRDYLDAWRSMGGALEQNRTDLLDADFVGTAKEKLADTVREQSKLGIETRYRDVSHDLQLVFYSPEGMSLQLLDTVAYEVQIVDQGKVLSTQQVRARYVAILTPTEVRWKVRVFQAEPE